MRRPLELLRPLDFTLAPVQGFVGQARRTNDFWAGSYIISYLTARAMVAVTAANENNDIVFPHVADDPLYMAVAGERIPQGPDDVGARVASLPNRFRALCRDPVAAGIAASAAVRDAWRSLASGVWTVGVRPLLLQMPEPLKNLVAEDLRAEGPGALPPTWERQISNLWEIYWVADARGAEVDERKNRRHLHLFSESGEVCSLCGERVVAFGSHLDRRNARRLWEDGVAAELNRRREFTLENGERLCSVCLVKRLWPSIATDVSGWRVRTSVKSTHQLCPPGPSPEESPFPYYAIVVMDGDGLGKLLNKYKDDATMRVAISEGLAGFSQAVPNIVESQYGGVCVYAGGDDVLALVPAAHALPCARKLRQRFLTAKDKAGINDPMTISASILFTHMKSPMQAAFLRAQRLLDDVAKDAMGRDAFVIQVEKRSGTPLRFAKKWDVEVGSGYIGDGTGADEFAAPRGWMERIEDLAATLLGHDPEHSSGYLYRTASFLTLAQSATIGGAGGGAELVPTLTVEYLRGPGRLLNVSWAEAESRARAVVELCRWQPGPEGKRGEPPFQPDALPAVRFLAEARKAGVT